MNLGIIYDKTLQQTFHQDYDVNLGGEGFAKDPESQEVIIAKVKVVKARGRLARIQNFTQ